MSNDWIHEHTLATAQSLFGTWWAMIEAQRECCDEPPIPDEAVVLHFMGSGASCQVYAKNIRDIINSFPKEGVCLK